MKVNPDNIKNDIVLDKYSVQSFIETCNLMDELHDRVFQGYIAKNIEKAEMWSNHIYCEFVAEMWCNHIYCEFVLAYMQIATNQLLVLHNIQNNKEE